MGADGRFEVVIGTQPSGQGHETSFAQVVADALQVAQHRLREKTFFRDCGLGTAEFLAIDSADDIEAARGFIDLLGLPMQVRGAKQGVPK